MEKKNIINRAVAVAFAVFTIYSAAIVMMEPFTQRNIHLSFALALTILYKPLASSTKRVSPKIAKIIDAILLGLVVVTGVYMATQATGLSSRQGLVYPADQVFFLLLVIVLLEAGRRLMGLAVPIIVIACLVYAWAGPYLPGMLGHGGQSLSKLTSYMYTGMFGIYGNLLGISANLVVLFVILGGLLEFSGVGNLFSHLAMSLFGRARGGPAKMGIFFSGLFGMISGSAAANVATTGSFTIPLMKRIGYKPVFAGAVEAVASSGGQFMPPIMGAGAFLMADMLGIPYIQVAKAAILPAILYYVALYFMVDKEAAKTGLKGLEASEVPRLAPAFSKIYLLLPIIVLLFLLLYERSSATMAGFWALIACIVVGFFYLVVHGLEGKTTVKQYGVKLTEGLETGVRNGLIVAAVTALAGIIVGVFGVTGLAIKISGLLTTLAGGNLLLLLILAMVASIILGMGLPTAAAYVLVAILVAPALIDMNVLPITAHLFVFYFAVLSAITPPVAVAAYTASGIAKADPMQIGFTAMRLGLVLYLIPYFMIYSPSLVLVGGMAEIIQTVITSLIGVYFLASGLAGYLFGHTDIVSRSLMIVGSILLIDPNLLTDIVGIILIGIGCSLNYALGRRSSEQEVGGTNISENHFD